MARFRFRLDASLQLAQQFLESAQRKYALEMKRWQACLLAFEAQKGRYYEAQENQRDAGRHRPEELRICQVFALEQRRRLDQCEAIRKEQELVMDNARRCLLEAHREVEKYERLKEKQATAFRVLELQKEQKILDETGQVLHWLGRISTVDKCVTNGRANL
ncbi:flagellar export protein FliJ [Desulfosporosinus nitroreducens]|uniref:flagellar export protein FliJ n=1 Tax=Desulfosporosinus nitroreducens TaxID=2018668 RepID=UPI00207CA04A|nr:flagellar FliJ family protein [Desulfosporosinus nitroreducens]MCO1601307.1 flagellar FliJ family protein [Desulfosporosinus nitroreducens]